MPVTEQRGRRRSAVANGGTQDQAGLGCFGTGFPFQDLKQLVDTGGVGTRTRIW